MPAVKFVGDEKAYLEWVNTHPNGYVINAHKLAFRTLTGSRFGIFVTLDNESDYKALYEA